MADLIDRQALRLAIFNTLWRDFRDVDIAYDMAESCPAVDAVSPGVYEQIKWERDIAMSQLEEHGIAFGAKKEAT